MIKTRQQLNADKDGLVEALRTLALDFEDELIDAPAYEAARGRYEREAAIVLRRLDALPVGPGRAERRHNRKEGGRTVPASPRLVATGIGMVFLASIVFFLLTSLHARGSNGVLTGSTPAAVSTPLPAAVVVAERIAQEHPHSVVALIQLGNALLQSDQVLSADAAYQSAMMLNPGAAEAPTLHAMIIGYGGHVSSALTLLHRVELDHPSFSRSWLLDGIFSTRGPRRARHYGHALHAWRRFLALEPRSPLGPEVRSWIVQGERAIRGK